MGSAYPTDSVVLHRLQFDALCERERGRQVVMKMANGVNVRPRAKDLAVQINLGGRPHVGRARYDRPVKITDQKIVRPNRRTALLERLYKECIAIGQPGRDMTAVAKDTKIVEQQSRGGDLVPKIFSLSCISNSCISNP